MNITIVHILSLVHLYIYPYISGMHHQANMKTQVITRANEMVPENPKEGEKEFCKFLLWWQIEQQSFLDPYPYQGQD